MVELKHFARRTQDSSGWTHQSAGEAKRAEELLLLEKAGEIRQLTHQPRIELTPLNFYKADFAYWERRFRVSDNAHRLIVEDVKGNGQDPSAERFRMVCRLWPYFGVGMLRVTKPSSRGFVITKEIESMEPKWTVSVLRAFLKKRSEPWAVEA